MGFSKKVSYCTLRDCVKRPSRDFLIVFLVSYSAFSGDEKKRRSKDITCSKAAELLRCCTNVQDVPVHAVPPECLFSWT